MSAIEAYIGIGANLGDPVAQVRQACRDLAERLPESRLMACSRLYRNPPLGPQEQPDYVNAVACLHTRLSARGLLSALQAIERHHGRDRSHNPQRWGPRTLDLDLLLFGDQVIHEPHLTVPHPGIAQRNFVLYPLLEIAPDLCIPQLGAVSALCAQQAADTLVAIASAEPGNRSYPFRPPGISSKTPPDVDRTYAALHNKQLNKLPR